MAVLMEGSGSQGEADVQSRCEIACRAPCGEVSGCALLSGGRRWVQVCMCAVQASWAVSPPGA